MWLLQTMSMITQHCTYVDWNLLENVQNTGFGHYRSLVLLRLGHGSSATFRRILCKLNPKNSAVRFCTGAFRTSSERSVCVCRIREPVLATRRQSVLYGNVAKLSAVGRTLLRLVEVGPLTGLMFDCHVRAWLWVHVSEDRRVISVTCSQRSLMVQVVHSSTDR
jgi:hypothetical protein